MEDNLVVKDEEFLGCRVKQLAINDGCVAVNWSYVGVDAQISQQLTKQHRWIETDVRCSVKGVWGSG